MENQIAIFQHEEFGKVRTLIIDGAPWFVGKDVAAALGYTNPRKAIGDHVDAEDKGVTNRYTLGGTQEMIIINESGLYALIFGSKLPKAKEFKHWVTSEVLPSIRKTGAYSLDNTTPPANAPLKYHEILEDIVKSAEILEKSFGVKHGIALAHCTNTVEKMHNLELGELKKFLPPAEHEVGYLTPTQIGKKIGKSAQYVNKKLIELGMQIKDSVCGYILTDKGKDYAERMPFERNGHSGYQLRWLDKILSMLGLKFSPSIQ